MGANHKPLLRTLAKSVGIIEYYRLVTSYRLARQTTVDHPVAHIAPSDVVALVVKGQS